jgi:hypothetical protein
LEKGNLKKDIKTEYGKKLMADGLSPEPKKIKRT